MIKASDYLPKQLNGEFATMLFECLTKPLSDTDEMLWSMYEYSIDTAVDENLDLLGQFVGLSRPLIPLKLVTEDALTFLQYNPAVEKDEKQGFASTAQLGGARFLSALKQNANYISDNWYRLILKGYAYLKWHGGSFESIGYVIDKFCSKWGMYIANENNKELGNILLVGEANTEPTRYLLEQIFDRWSYGPQILLEIGYPMPTPTEVDGWKPLLRGGEKVLYYKI